MGAVLPMTNDSPLRHCLLCTNRQSHDGTGIVCGLTNLPPAFVHDCSSFQADEPEYQRIGSEKLERYGLTVTETHGIDIAPESVVVSAHLYERTQFRSFVEPNDPGQLGESFPVRKSLVKYGIFTLIPIVFLIMGFNGLLESHLTRTENGIIYSVMAACVVVLALVLVDYIRNNNEFDISERGIYYREALIPWRVILATLTKRPQGNPRKISLVLSVATARDIEINLTGLNASPEKIENAIELYKERHRHRSGDAQG